jgi:SAM-dependent methyltransferase
VLDASCGPGGVLPRLYAAVAPGGSVLGIDSSTPHVERARQVVRERRLEGVIAVEGADRRAALPVAPESCDAVWIAAVLYPDTVDDPIPVVARLSHTLMPGGLLAIFYGNWRPPLYLAGYARLEHLICAARETVYVRECVWQESPHPESPLVWLRQTGLDFCQLQVFPVVHRQPLPADVRDYLSIAILSGHYAWAVAEGSRDVGMTPEDEDLWRKLSDPQGSDFILNQSDYYCVAIPILALGRQLA